MTAMVVAITGLGSVWRRRFGKCPNKPTRFARAAYYNTTGVLVNGTIRTRTRIAGHARFNSAGRFDPNYPQRTINRVFECDEPCVWQGQNKILFERKLTAPAVPDAFLVVTRTETTGALKVGTTDWCSTDTWLISLSQCRNRQEALLLMPAYGWIQSELGKFVLKPSATRPWVGRLLLVPG